MKGCGAKTFALQHTITDRTCICSKALKSSLINSHAHGNKPAAHLKNGSCDPSPRDVASTATNQDAPLELLNDRCVVGTRRTRFGACAFAAFTASVRPAQPAAYVSLAQCCERLLCVCEASRKEGRRRAGRKRQRNESKLRRFRLQAVTGHFVSVNAEPALHCTEKSPLVALHKSAVAT